MRSSYVKIFFKKSNTKIILRLSNILRWFFTLKYARMCIARAELNYSFKLLLSGFFFTDTDNLQDSRGREGIFFYSTSTTSTRSQTLRYLYATLHVR